MHIPVLIDGALLDAGGVVPEGAALVLCDADAVAAALWLGAGLGTGTLGLAPVMDGLPIPDALTATPGALTAGGSVAEETAGGADVTLGGATTALGLGAAFDAATLVIELVTELGLTVVSSFEALQALKLLKAKSAQRFRVGIFSRSMFSPKLGSPLTLFRTGRALKLASVRVSRAEDNYVPSQKTERGTKPSSPSAPQNYQHAATRHGDKRGQFFPCLGLTDKVNL